MTTHRQRVATSVADRIARMQAIARHGSASREELTVVAGWLGSESKVVQRCAAQTLAELGRQQSVVHDLLLRRLRSEPAHGQWGVLYALALMSRLPADALPILLRVLGSLDGDVRWAAVHMLVRIREEPGVAAAVRAVARAGEVLQRKMAAYCLRDFGFVTPETEAVLVPSLRDEHPEVRLAAVAALSRVACDRARVAGGLIGLLLEDTNQGVRRAAAAALGRLRHDSSDVIAALRHAAGGSDSSLRRAAERSLRLLGVPMRRR